MIKAVIFDCFGVLYPQAIGAFFTKHENLFSNNPELLDRLSMQIDLGQITRSDFFAELEKETGISGQKIQAEIDKELVVDQQLIAFIKKLKAKYKIGLLSNAGQEEISIVYRDGIDVLFDSITVSYEVGFAKPNPEIYRISSQRTGVSPAECVFVDDTKINIEAAHNFGMQAILYDHFGTLPKKLKTLLQ